MGLPDSDIPDPEKPTRPENTQELMRLVRVRQEARARATKKAENTQELLRLMREGTSLLERIEYDSDWIRFNTGCLLWGLVALILLGGFIWFANTQVY